MIYGRPITSNPEEIIRTPQIIIIDDSFAHDPVPVDGEVLMSTWANLSWSPGDFAVLHSVYFGDNLQDVFNGTGDTFQRIQTSASFTVGTPDSPYPDGLVPGTTYYWRIDEVQDNGIVYKGDVWSFVVLSVRAYAPSPADGAESVDQNLQLSWMAGFGAILHIVYFGDSFEDVEAGIGDTYKGLKVDTTHDLMQLEKGKTYYWRIDEFDAINTYEGDVWSFTTTNLIPPTTLNVPSDEYPTIQRAIDAAIDGDKVVVADGTYTGTGNRDIDFLGKAITVCSENGPERCIIDCQGRYEEPHRGFHFHSGETLSSVLDGFTITGGFIPSTILYHAGAIYCDNSSPTIANNIIENNYAANFGAIYCDNNSSPHIISNTIIDNSSSSGGGGICCNGGSSPIIVNNIISRNHAGYGAGICVWSSSPIITGNIISNNSVPQAPGYSGGGIDFLYFCPAVVQNNVITGNIAYDGGGISGLKSFGPIITNNTITGNTANLGGGISGEESSLTVLNSILWNDSQDEIYLDDSSTIDITYSDIQGGWPGTGNIQADPCFVNAFEGDYQLLPDSPCIDAGTNTPVGEIPPTDIEENPRPQDGNGDGFAVADMGAYEVSGTISLPVVAYIYRYDEEAAQNFQSLLVAYGCSTTLISLDEIPAAKLDSYDIIIVGNDTGYNMNWGNIESVTAIEGSSKPIIGLGEGGYAFFGQLELSIGWPHGMHGSNNSIKVIDPNHPVFISPYAIDIPQDLILQLYMETNCVTLYLNPVPETVTVLGTKVDNSPYYPLALEHNRYLFWGFSGSPESMTGVGELLFINVVIWIVNTG